MRHDGAGQLDALAPKPLRLAGRERPGAPLRGGSSEDLNRFTSIVDGARNGRESAAGNGLMGSEKHATQHSRRFWKQWPVAGGCGHQINVAARAGRNMLTPFEELDGV